VPGWGFDLRVRYVCRAVQVRGRWVDVVRAHRLIEGLADVPGDAAGRPDDLRVGVQVRQPQRHVRLFAGDSLELLGDPATARGAGEQAATVSLSVLRCPVPFVRREVGVTYRHHPGRGGDGPLAHVVCGGAPDVAVPLDPHPAVRGIAQHRVDVVRQAFGHLLI